jgi:hypothetical protein
VGPGACLGVPRRGASRPSCPAHAPPGHLLLAYACRPSPTTGSPSPAAVRSLSASDLGPTREPPLPSRAPSRVAEVALGSLSYKRIYLPGLWSSGKPGPPRDLPWPIARPNSAFLQFHLRPKLRYLPCLRYRRSSRINNYVRYFFFFLTLYTCGH